MKKSTLIILLIVAVAAAGFIYSLFRKGNTNGQPPAASGSVTVPVPSQGPTTWTEPVASEQIPPVAVDPLAGIDIPKLGTVLDRTGTVEVDTPYKQTDFDILYYAIDRSVSITLLKEPVRETRIRAEQTFLEKFGVTKAAACRMRVTLSSAVGDDMTNYGLSFCPNGIPIP